MWARFRVLMGANETENARSTRTRFAPRIRPLEVALVSLAAIVAVIAVFVAARQALKWISAARVVPALSTPATTPSPGPVAAVMRTGAISGQVRASNEEFLRNVRVSVTTIPKPGLPSTEITVEANADGKYRLDNIPAGQYYVLARFADASTYYPGSIDIAGATIVSIPPGAILEGIDFPSIASAGRSLSAAVPIELAEIAGRVLLEDGSEVSDPQSLGEIAISLTGNSSSIAATTMRLDGNGRFHQALAAGEYRFRIEEFSQNYLVRSVTAGGADLLKENLEVNGNSPVSVEIRVARRNDSGAGKVLGQVLDTVDVTLRLDTGDRLPYWPDTSIVFTGTTGAFRVAASCVVGNLFRASVPADESFVLTVTNVAAGYAVQSIVDTRMTDLMHGGVFRPAAGPSAPSRIVVTLTRN
jgi:hypothetical protein